MLHNLYTTGLSGNVKLKPFLILFFLNKQVQFSLLWCSFENNKV